MSYYSNQYQQPPVGAPPPQGYYPNKSDAVYPPPQPGYPHPPYASTPPYAPPTTQTSAQRPEQQSISCLEACLATLCCCCLLDAIV